MDKAIKKEFEKSNQFLTRSTVIGHIIIVKIKRNTVWGTRTNQNTHWKYQHDLYKKTIAFREEFAYVLFLAG